MLNPIRIENQMFKAYNEVLSARELDGLFDQISASVNVLAEVEGVQDLLRNRLHTWLGTESLSRFAVFLQASLKAPFMIAPCLQRCSAISELNLHECSFLSKDTIVLLVKNCASSSSESK
jgi:hypothetical protein